MNKDGSAMDQDIRIHAFEAHHHTFAYGPTHVFAEYLRERASSFIFIQHPFAHRRFYPSTVELYISGRLVRRIAAPSIRGPQIVLFIKDLLLTIIFAVAMRHRAQLFIGADALNALGGMLLHKMGLVRSVVLFAIDYTPRRFSNSLINSLYHTLNVVVARHCNMIWAVSKRIKRAYREIYGAQCPIIIVPAGAHRPPVLPDPQIRHNRLVFLGNIDESKGLQLVIRALPLIRERIPQVKTLVIGTGSYYDDLVKLANELEVQDAIEFIGHLPNHERVMLTLTRCDVGLAPYVPEATSISVYGDPCKIKEYLIAGLPVIVTDVPETAREVSAMCAGTIIDYKVESLANAIIHLLGDQALLQTYKKNAIRLGQEYLWDKIFNHTMAETIRILGK